jgi:NDP-sugar pyrophosphorylase family protein/aminoglycoside/choline kinase family phosphotransferase
MLPPRKAVVLAAGFGTRLLPLSLDTPKPMVPLWGKPALGHVLDLLQDWGVRETLINLHFHPDAIVRYAAGRSRPDFRITFSFEPDILGTGGALRRAAWFLPEAEPFWLINADIAADLRPDPFLGALRHRNTLAALWLHPSLGPRTVAMRRGFITDFQSARPETPGTYTFCGLHLIRPGILDFLPAEGFATIIAAYNRALAAGRRLAGVCAPDCYWEDLGTPESYRLAHGEVRARHRRGEPGGRLYDPGQTRRARALRRAGARLDGFVALGRDASVAPGARVADSVLWDGATVAPGAEVLGAVVGTDTRVRGRVRRLALRSEFMVRAGDTHADLLLGRVLRALEWPADRTVVEPFEPRGSARSFTRLRCGRRSAILVRYSLDRHENALYADHARFLKRLGLRVPEVLLDWPAERALALEDLGGRSLQEEVAVATPERFFTLYAPVLDAAHRLHSRGARAALAQRLELTPPFSADLYRWEREFFARHFLRRRLGLPEPAIRAALRDLGRIAERLASLPQVLIHRDLQSSNVLLIPGGPAFIDFQGMRLGPAAYDLASLLCDPYVAMPSTVRERLLQRYADRAGWSGAQRDAFWWAALERLAQALGAYGRLGASPETAWFARYIRPALERMREALDRLPVLPGLRAIVRSALQRD